MNTVGATLIVPSWPLTAEATRRGRAAAGRRGAMALALALGIALAGCDIPSGGAMAPRSVAVAGGSLVLAAPQGFCVDQTASRQDEAGAFVLFANCAALSNNPAAPQPAAPVVLTVAVSGAAPTTPLAESFPQMQAFFASDAGRAALSRSGRAGSVEVLETQISDGMLLIKLSDRSQAGGPPVADEYWRAITGIGGRILSLSVLPLRERPVDDARQRALIEAFAARIRAAN